MFGLYLIWMACLNLNKLEINEISIRGTIDKFENEFDLHKILSFCNLNNHLPIHEIRKYKFNTDNLKNAAKEILYLMNVSLIIGGILCIFGYKVSFSFILLGLLLDLIFIHNYFYFRDEKMKVNVLKMLAILGGALQLN